MRDTVLIVKFGVLAIILAGTIFATIWYSGESNHANVKYVVDGDTIEVSKGTVRLAGVDTPETRQCYGDEATQFTRRVVKDDVKLHKANENRGEYGRLIRYVESGDIDVGAELVEHGYAYASDFEHPRKSEYDRLERQARSNGSGLWSVCHKTGEGDVHDPR